MIQETNRELPALLQAAHISDPALSARITAAVNLILTSVSSFASLIPQAGLHGGRWLDKAPSSLSRRT
jgi:hypothetical protein